MKNNQDLNKQYVDYLRNFGYMKGVDRSNRIKSTQEIFTPIGACEYYCSILTEYKYSNSFTDVSEKIIDNSAGDGEWLGACLIKRLENSIDFESALSTIYGVDLMPDNVKLCQDRLLCGQEHLRHIVKKNIVCADALKYHYRFDGTPYDVVETKEEKAARIKKERDTVKKQKEREKAERLAKKEEARIEREKSKSKLTILDPDLFEF